MSERGYAAAAAQSAHVRNIARMSASRRQGEKRRMKLTLGDLKSEVRSIRVERGDGDARRENGKDDVTIDDPFVEERMMSPTTVSVIVDEANEDDLFVDSEPEFEEKPFEDVRIPRASADPMMGSPIVCDQRSTAIDDSKTYSKTSRSRSYKPKTLAEYRKYVRNDVQREPLGKLQPDLNKPELLKLRAKKERVRAFSERLRQVNASHEEKKKERRMRKSSTSAANRRSDDVPKTLSTRERALAFAKTIPKPVMKTSSRTAQTTKAQSFEYADRVASSCPTRSRLDELRARHHEFCAKTSSIRNKYGG